MIQERIIKYLDFKGISKYKFYKETGISNGFLDKKGSIGTDKCEIICSYYIDLNPTWLITGNGDMLLGIAETAKNYYKNIPNRLMNQVNEPLSSYAENSIPNECVKLIENYQVLLNQKDILINELKLLLEESRNSVKFSKVNQ